MTICNFIDERIKTKMGRYNKAGLAGEFRREEAIERMDSIYQHQLHEINVTRSGEKKTP